MSRTQDPTEGQVAAPAQPSLYGQAVKTYAPLVAKHLVRAAANGVAGSMGMPPFSGGQPPRSVSQTQVEGRNAARRGRRPGPGSTTRDPNQTEPGTLAHGFPRPPPGEQPEYEGETGQPAGEEPQYEAPGAEPEYQGGPPTTTAGRRQARGEPFTRRPPPPNGSLTGTPEQRQQAARGGRQQRRPGPFSKTPATEEPNVPPGGPAGPNGQGPMEGVRPTTPPAAHQPPASQTAPAVLPSTYRFPGIDFPVSYLNPTNMKNNCVYVTMAACMGLPLDKFLQLVNVQITQDIRGVELPFILFLLQRTNRHFIFEPFDPSRQLESYHTETMNKIGIGFFGEISPGKFFGHAIMSTDNGLHDGQAGAPFLPLLRQELKDPGLVIEDENIAWVFRIDEEVAESDEEDTRAGQRAKEAISAAQMRAIQQMEMRIKAVRAAKGQTPANPQTAPQPHAQTPQAHAPAPAAPQAHAPAQATPQAHPSAQTAPQARPSTKPVPKPRA